MGTVYEAEQEDPHRRVALKVIRGEIEEDDTQVRLFRREAEALARLEHPGIASIYTAGRSDAGQHYFAMELVEGETLEDWILRHGAWDGRQRETLVQRLELFCEVARAVAFAHQRGVIHRDLKPTNVMVTAASEQADSAGAHPARIKILDFGLSRMIDVDGTRARALSSVLEDSSEICGTLAYMSPEQLSGDSSQVDVRSDVYALGLLVYELLAGRSPYETEPSRPYDLARVIIEDNPRTLRCSLGESARPDRDLETIIGKALEKDPNRRYGGAEALLEDIRRWLENQPIAARPPSTGYQVRMLIRRHKFPALLVAFSALTLVVAAIGLSILATRLAQERDRATQEAHTSQRVTKLLERVFEEPDPLVGGGGETTARQLLDRGVERISEELREEPRTRATLLLAIGRVYSNLGLYKQSKEQFEIARKQMDPLESDPAAVAELTGRLGAVEVVLGNLDLAEDLLTESLLMMKNLHGPESAETAEALERLSHLRRIQHRLEEAVQMQRRALAIRELRFGRNSIESANSLNALAELALEANKPEKALVDLERALTIRQGAYGEAHPIVARTLDSLASAHRLAERFDQAEAMYLRALDIRKSTLGDGHTAVSNVLNNLAELYRTQGRFDEALEVLEQSTKIRRAALGESSPDVAKNFVLMGDLRRLQGRAAEAVELVERGLALYRKAYGQEHGRVAEAINTLANLHYALGQLEKSEELHHQALEIRKRVYGPGHPMTSNSLSNLAAVYYRQKKFAQAEELLRRGLEDQLAALGDNHLDVAMTMSTLGSTLIMEGKLEQASPFLERALAIRREKLGDEHNTVAGSWNTLGKLRGLQRSFDQSEECFERALAIREKLLGPDHRLVASVLKNYESMLRTAGRIEKADRIAVGMEK